VAWSILLTVTLAVGLGLDWSGRTGVAWLRQHTSLLQVREVNSAETVWMPRWEVVEASGLAPGDDILEIPVELAEERVRAHPRVRDARVVRQWSGKIRIEVTEYRPLAIFADQGVLEIGLGGAVLGAPPGPRPVFPGGKGARGLHLPVISGIDTRNLEPGDVIDHAGARRALAFLALMEHYGYAPSSWISEVDVGAEDSLVLHLLDGGTPVRVGTGRISRTKVRALFGALDELKARDIRPGCIDLRFMNQIVVKDIDQIKG